MDTNGGIVLLEEPPSLRAEAFALGNFRLLQLVVSFKVRNFVGIEAEKDTYDHQYEVNVSADEGTVIKPCVLIPRGRYYFVR